MAPAAGWRCGFAAWWRCGSAGGGLGCPRARSRGVDRSALGVCPPAPRSAAKLFWQSGLDVVADREEVANGLLQCRRRGRLGRPESIVVPRAGSGTVAPRECWAGG